MMICTSLILLAVGTQPGIADTQFLIVREEIQRFVQIHLLLDSVIS